jgi:hypothetical protein
MIRRRFIANARKWFKSRVPFAKRTALLILIQISEWNGFRRGLIHTQSQPLLLNLQIDIELVLAVE